MKHKKYHLIYFFSLLLFILSFISTTTAQTSYLDSLDGKFALQFQISHNFSIENFQGATFSGKYHVGKRDALRFGISYVASIYNDEEQKDYFNPDTTTFNQSEFDGFALDFKFQYIRYIVSNDDVSFYCGGGPSVQFENRESTNEGRLEGRDLWGLGINILAGVEWMFNKNMSLSAEYGVRFRYYSYEDISTYSDYKLTHRTESFNISADEINFGISVYF